MVLSFLVHRHFVATLFLVSSRAQKWALKWILVRICTGHWLDNNGVIELDAVWLKNASSWQDRKKLWCGYCQMGWRLFLNIYACIAKSTFSDDIFDPDSVQWKIHNYCQNKVTHFYLYPRSSIPIGLVKGQSNENAITSSDNNHWLRSSYSCGLSDMRIMYRNG